MFDVYDPTTYNGTKISKETLEIISKPAASNPLKDKLKGQRLGQALWNALDEHVKRDIGDSSEALTNHEMLMTLWNISDEELRKLLNDYLREL